MPKQAYASRKFYSGTFSLLSTGSTAVLDALTGKSFLATRAWLEITANTGTPAVNPIIVLGNNSTNFNNLMTDTTVPVVSGLNNDCQVYELPLGSINPATYVVGRRWKRLDIGSTGISVKVNTAASGGTVSVLTGRIYIEGILL